MFTATSFWPVAAPAWNARAVPPHLVEFSIAGDLQPEREDEVIRTLVAARATAAFAGLGERTLGLRPAELPAAARQAFQRCARPGAVQPCTQEAGPVVRLHAVQRLDDVVEGVGHAARAAIVVRLHGR